MKMILPIQTGRNNPILRQKAKGIKDVNAEIQQLILDMAETMEKENGLGLAAPQVNKSQQVIVAKSDKKNIALINPQIKEYSKKTYLMEEGCLSLPDQYCPIKRPYQIRVEGLNQRGEKIDIKASGLLARIIQHEIDHLNGILIIDK